MKVLIAGWFSFEHMGATAGDLLARDLACEWVEAAGLEYHVAVAPPFTDGIDWRSADPTVYSHIVFVCGPFGNGPPITGFLDRFRGRPLIGLNLSMLEPLDAWNPFQRLWARDSATSALPDITFASKVASVPVVGVVLVHPQKEYGARAMHDAAYDYIRQLLDAREVSAIPIDTRLDKNATGLRTPQEVESVIARMDVVITTRLHGLVLSLKHGVPALAIDPIAGGAKVLRQAETVGWPAVFTADALEREKLAAALDYCLTPEARSQARACSQKAQRDVRAVRQEFVRALRNQNARKG